ncbi:MAG: YbaB/EbfC family nucleoid-associated protein [bacterium]|nr:YbaB/EbfC family nucleoid-associated protein [bacterium]
MNMQAMLKQAQKLQKDMLEEQEKINNKEFVGKSSIVTVIMTGEKQLKEVKIDSQKLELDDVEFLQDMIVIAVNDAIKQINEETENKMGKYTKGMPGLF